MDFSIVSKKSAGTFLSVTTKLSPNSFFIIPNIFYVWDVNWIAVKKQVVLGMVLNFFSDDSREPIG